MLTQMLRNFNAKMDCGQMIHFVMTETTHLNATLMEVLVATIACHHGITSALSVNALKKIMPSKVQSLFKIFDLLHNDIVRMILYQHA